MKRSNILQSIRLILKILPLAFWIILIFAFDKPYIAILTVICALLHELGHILAFMFFSRNYRLFSVTSGFRLASNERLSYKEELFIALSGPLINIILFLLASPFVLFHCSEYARIFGLINLFTAISNLIPIEGYDGYRVAECFINQYSSLRISNSLLRSVSFLFSAILCLTALYLIRSFDGGYWIFFIFLASLLKAISRDTSVFRKK